MRICTSLGQERVRIIEVPDKRGPDNQGSTVARSGIDAGRSPIVAHNKTASCYLIFHPKGIELFRSKNNGRWNCLACRTTTFNYQSTLRPPEVHILYVHFNCTSAFALRIWELMICVVCGRPQNFVRNTKGYNSRKTSQISSGS